MQQKTGRQKKVIYAYLRQWWQGGRRKNVFLPKFKNCGSPGKRRLAESQEVNKDHPKIGRRSALAISTGQTETGIGVRITKEIENRFKKGIKRYYKTTEKRSLNDAFELTLQKYFHCGIEIIDGAVTYIMPPDEQLPTFDQFRYWYETYNRDPEDEMMSREGGRVFLLEGRELLGTSREDAFGPGSQFQIDATIGDAHIVSALDPLRIIGKPVIYDCVDVF